MRAKYYRLKESLQAYEAIEYLECLTGARLSPDEMLEVIESQKVPFYLDMLAVPIDAHIIQSDGRIKAAIMPTALQRFLGGLDENPYRHLKASTELEQVHFLISPDVAFSELLEKHYPWFNQLFLEGEIKAVESGEAETLEDLAAQLFNFKRAMHDANKYRQELYLLDVDCINGGVSYPNAYWGIHRDFFTPEREEIALEALFKPIDIEALAAIMNNEPKAQALQQETEALKVEVALAREPKQTRSNPIREVMLGIVEDQPDISSTKMWAKLKEMAENQEWPFVGVVRDSLKYEDNTKHKTVNLKSVRDRLKRIKEAR